MGARHQWIRRSESSESGPKVPRPKIIQPRLLIPFFAGKLLVSDGQSAAAAIISEKPELVFLDIQMPEMDGFAVINRVGIKKMPATIFVTAYDQYALAAFDASALDYLLKPFGKARFDRALARARERLTERPDHGSHRASAASGHFFCCARLRNEAANLVKSFRQYQDSQIIASP